MIEDRGSGLFVHGKKPRSTVRVGLATVVSFHFLHANFAIDSTKTIASNSNPGSTERTVIHPSDSQGSDAASGTEDTDDQDD
jgi:hypothetical protein